MTATTLARPTRSLPRALGTVDGGTPRLRVCEVNAPLWAGEDLAGLFDAAESRRGAVRGRRAGDLALVPAPAPRPRSVRLTRRGRVVLCAVLAVAALVLFSLGRASAGAHAATARHTVTVQSGDTLWGIAQRVAPGADPRAEVAALAQANQLDPGADLAPGAVLVLPAG